MVKLSAFILYGRITCLKLCKVGQLEVFLSSVKEQRLQRQKIERK